MSGALKDKPKIIAIVGPTASGKSELAVKLAKEHNGEILSVDSRQIYQGMDIGTGKVPGKFKIIDGKKIYAYKNIPHYGIDIASPKRQYSVAQFQKYASKIINQIIRKGKLPILCGGTAHWMDAVVYGQEFPAIKSDKKLRAELSKLSAEELFKKLKKLDRNRAKTIDPKNPRRLIRAIEIVSATGKTVPKLKHSSPYNITWIGINPGMEKLQEKIHKRLNQRVRQGMFHEIKTLHKQGISWQKMWNFGLEYRYGSMYLQNKMDKKAALEKLQTEIRQYAKRQLTWWKRNEDITWL